MSSPSAAQALAMLSHLTPQQMAMTPVAPPPPGIIPNFKNPATRLPDLLGVGIPFFTIATAMIAVRVYMKGFVLKKWRIEDTTLTIGYFITLIYYVLMCCGATKANVGRHIYELHLSEMYGPLGFWIGIWSSSVPAQVAFGFVKASLFLQYYSLFKSTQWLKICILGGLVFNVLFYLGVTITLIVLQTPWPGQSILQTIFSDHVGMCRGLFLPTGIIGVLIDWYLLVLPIPAVWGLNLSMSKKLGVLTIFMTGSLACIAGVISLYYRTTLATILLDPTWGMVTILNWMIIELVCGIIACCMPTIHLFWNRHTSLVSFGSRVKTSMRSALRITRTRTRSSRSYPVSGEKEVVAHWRAPPATASDKTMTKDEILVIQGYSVDHTTRTTDSDSFRYHNQDDAESQKRPTELW